MVQNLTLFASLANPLTLVSRIQFDGIYKKLVLLLDQLTSRQIRLKRRLKFIRLRKRATGGNFLSSSAILAIAFVVLAIHSLFGLSCGRGAFMGCVEIARSMPDKKMSKSSHKRLDLQYDLAAKGVYILTKDLETMWRLAIKIHNDVEHTKAVAEMCVRNSQCQELIKEAMGELNKRNNVFLEQLKEHEEHLYLCFLTINRSRRQVAEEIMASQKPKTHGEHQESSHQE